MRKTTRWIVPLVVVLLAAAACSKGPTDAALTTSIEAAMFSNAGLKESNLKVSVKDGEVTLTGTVPNDGVRLEAYKLASGIAGVKKVNDQMTVEVAQVVPELVPEPVPAPAPVRTSPRSRPAPVPVSTSAPREIPPPPPPAVESAPAAQPAPAPPPPPPAPQARKVQIPAGTTIPIRMIDSIDSEVNKTGELFRASLDAPIQVDGDDVIPEGADVWVKLVEAKSAGRMTGRSELDISIVKLEFQGRSYNLESSVHEQQGSSRGKNTAAKVGVGAAIGAVIGGIAGGGKGAAIGAAAGGGLGAGVQIATKGQQVRVPSETRIDFRLEAPVTVTLRPESSNQ